MTKTNTTQKANGNCKKVRCITTNTTYNSVKEAAKANNVAGSTMSVAINRGYVCNGNLFIFEEDLHKKESADKMCEQIVREKTRADRAEATRDEMAEFRKWKAEQEAIRAAEEKARKEEEKRQEMLTKAKEKVARYRARREKVSESLQHINAKLMRAEMELEALLGDEEVA